MAPTSLVLSVLALATLAVGTPLAPYPAEDVALPPQLAAAVNNGYAPARVACPSGLSVRRPTPAQKLNADELAYVKTKMQGNEAAWRTYLVGAGISIDVESFVAGVAKGVPGVDMPNIGIAVSGGGERAMLVGGGIISALDPRNSSSAASGVAILPVVSYLAGLSGGSWMTFSWATSGFPTFTALRDGVWNLQESFSAPEQADPYFVADITESVVAKSAAGFNVSYNDAWGRQLSYHLINETGTPTKGPGVDVLISSIRDTPAFASHTAPYPVIIAINRLQGQINATVTSPILEFSPYEFGSFDPTLSPGAFIPIDYLGTEMVNGAPASGPAECVTGFENAAFAMAASGEYLGAAAQLALGTAGLSATGPLADVLGKVPDSLLIDARIPSPFTGLNPSTFTGSALVELDLVDGGLAGENVPFTPLISRGLDVIIAVDGSADTNNFPDGQEPRHTYEKSLLPGFAGNFPFPYFPPSATFLAQGLNKRISFFGSACTNVSATPLIVYVPNYNIVAATNTSTFTNDYPVQQQIDFFNNGAAIATQSGSKTWPTCFACAVVDAQLARNGGSRSPECAACFAEYCYYGTSD